ncbi:MFS transporter [Caballeronia sp. LZ001]|uniref:MFS transporter n=1 Tax=Caballeronia sp. LZ001 TaxID=3038553 RepID=UPI00285A6F66|nr:MFS transporter [Caballeronia sp. LZ001]MDR5806588.1 MFS transporter [Caballeronia sp. LZ001]
MLTPNWIKGNDVSGAREFKTGWGIILAATIGIGTSLTTMASYSAGVFLPSLTKTFGWADSQVMITFMILFFGSSLLGPTIGTLADRIGPRKIVLCSVVGLAIGWMLLAFTTSSIISFYAIFAIITLLGAGTLPVTWTKSVVVHFKEKRGIALGICLVGTGIFGALIKQYAFHTLNLFGWRMAYVSLGAFLLVITLPIAFFFFREPAVDDMAHATTASDASTALPGLTMKQALRTPAFWILSASFFLLSLSLAGIAPNLERFWTKSGFSMSDAVSIASWYGIGIVLGRLITGWFLDRIWAPLVVFTMLLPCAAAFLLLAHGVNSFWVASLLVLIVGTSSGVEYDALAYLVSRYFGMRAYSAIYGGVFIGFAVGAGLGPFSFSKLLSMLDGYDAVLIINAAIVVVGAGVLLFLGAYPRAAGNDDVAKSSSGRGMPANASGDLK